ncbi:PREDICTED: NADH dehydrogenase [ubiquinone] 1 beta subcomplex subunit 11, mitochondrial [Eufriesea mexicana]|nr:PREDICTED: NADH dehydrogenase [ubiquinone] 1 beta subcomplex subunit 11, mitochondrial [Eufriesea mexicana]
MSMLLRLVRSHGIKRGLTFLTSKEVKIYNKAFYSNVPQKKTDIEDTYEVKSTWVSFGFDDKDKKVDRQAMHLTLFVSISICLVCGSFVLGYMPDPRLKDWSQREAFLQIRYKEEHGLPLIDPNIVDPSKFTLPSEEELAGIEIII